MRRPWRVLGPIVPLMAVVPGDPVEATDPYTLAIAECLGAPRDPPGGWLQPADPEGVRAAAAARVGVGSGAAALDAFLIEMGLLEAGRSLQDLLVECARVDACACFDPTGGKVLVARSEPGLRRCLAISMELARGLRAGEHPAVLGPVCVTEDGSLARSALALGDAALRAERCLYQARDHVPPDLTVDEAPRNGRRAALAAAGVPQLALELTCFPAEAGLRFVRQLRDHGGDAAVARAFVDPPESMEQVLHPRLYLVAERDRPRMCELPDLAAPDASAEQFESTLGEAWLELLVRLAGDPVRAIEAAAGWDGDRLRVASRDRGAAGTAVWVLAFDTDQDARQTAEALRRVFERCFQGRTPSVAVHRDESSGGAQARFADGTLRAAVLCRGDRVRLVWSWPGPLSGPWADVATSW